MTCANLPGRFRLLDCRVGWDCDNDKSESIDGLDDESGIRLRDPDAPRVSSRILTPFVGPAWLAHGCGPCDWYLANPSEADPRANSGFLHFDACSESWMDLSGQLAGGEWLIAPTAVAWAPNRLALLDAGRAPSNKCQADVPAQLFLWSLPEGRLAGLVKIGCDLTPTAIVFASWCEWLVAVCDNGTTKVRRYDRVGTYLGDAELPGAKHPIQRLARGNDGAVWTAVGTEDGPFDLWKMESTCGGKLRLQKFEEIPLSPPLREDWLRKTFGASGVTGATHNLVCLQMPSSSSGTPTKCFSRRGGSPSAQEVSVLTAGEPKQLSGSLKTKPLDSLLPRCRWHRIQVDADIPPDSTLKIRVATWEKSDPGSSDLEWQVVDNACDFLIQQAPGRYLFVDITLIGTQQSSPVVRGLRIDFPRVTSLDQLPAVYREDPRAEDFSERFLSLFDRTVEELDQTIECFPGLLDIDKLPDDALPWLATFLGIAFDPTWNAETRRRLLHAVPQLYRQRGTVAGLSLAIEVLFGVRPVVNERMFQRAWGAVKQSRLGTVRLFGASRSRFRIGRSPLGQVPLRSYGNPDHDPFRSEAHRFSILMPPSRSLQQLGTEQLERLIDSQKPAHTAHNLRIGGQGFVVGRTSVVGIDSQFIARPPVVLGSAQGNFVRSLVRLNHNTVLRSGRQRSTRGLRIGKTSTVGIHTILE